MKWWIDRWNSYWFPQSTPIPLSIFRIVAVGAQLLFFLPSIDTNLNLLEKNETLLSPQFLIVAITAIIPEQLFLTPTTFAIIRWITIFAGVTCLIGFWTRASAFIFALGNWIFIAHRYSYADIHHPEAVFCIFLMLLAFSPSGAALSVDSLLNRRRINAVFSPEELDTAVWPIRFVHILLALTYFSTGASKLIYGGLQWINGNTLQQYILTNAVRKDLELGIWMAQQPTLCRLLSVYTIVFELFFFVSVVMPSTARYVLLSGIVFQIGLYAVSGHPFFEHLVLLILLFGFFEAERGRLWLKKKNRIISMAAAKVG